MINQNFSQQILKKGAEKYNFPIANPFAGDGEEVASVAYRYRKFQVSDEISMMVRCQLDGVLEPKTTDGADAGESQFMTSMALNEFDPRVCKLSSWLRAAFFQLSRVSTPRMCLVSVARSIVASFMLAGSLPRRETSIVMVGC